MSTLSSSLNLAAGEKLAGAYTLKNPLGGEAGLPVWQAHDDELDRDVTLHFLPDAVRADPRAMSELRAAVRRNRQLIHPRIVRVHDLIEEENWAAITMDHIDGQPLTTVLRERPGHFFETGDIAPWVSQLCHTLEEAHKIELFHGDLAPVNLMVGKNGDLHVANFGISRVVLDVLARAHQPVRGEGDIAYASPQQLNGERLGKSDDIYALGVVLYELLTGKPPFHSGDLLSQIRKNTAPLIAERRAELKIEGEPIAPEWENAVVECLEKNAGARPKSALEVAAKLGADKSLAAAKPGEKYVQPGMETALATDALPERMSSASEAKPLQHPTQDPELPAAKFVSTSTVPAREGGSLTTQAEHDARNADYRLDEDFGTPEVDDLGEGVSIQKPVPGKHFPRSSFLEIPHEGQGQSRVPKIAFGVAALLIVIGIAGFLLPKSPQKADETRGEVQPVNVAETEKPPVPEEAQPTPVPVVVNQPLKREVTAAATPVPPSVPLTGTARLAQVEQIAVAKSRAAANAQKAAAAAESAHVEKMKLQERADAAAQEAQKAADDRAMAAAALKKSNEDIVALRKQREDARAKAEAEASEAAQLAAEKARLADDAKKAALDLIQQTNEKMAQQQKADNEVLDLQKVAGQKQQLAAAAAKSAMEAESVYKQQLAGVKQAEEEAAQAQSNVQRAKAAEEARQAAAEADQLRMASEKEAQRLEAQAAEAEKVAANAKEAVKRAREAAGEAERQRKAREDARKKAEAEDGAPAPKDTKPSASVIPESLGPESAKLVLKTETKMESPAKPGNSKIPSVSVRVPESRATVAKALQNSLGMKFAPVGESLFSVGLTRVKDFEVFAKATNLKASSWRRPDFQQGAEHPAVNVNWIDAVAFCKWLSEKEQKEGFISSSQLYRLPTDLEWSRAVGLPEESGRTPEARDMGVADIYPWGTQWPPPPGAGNYTGEETNSDVAIKGYHDGFPYTSPVGAFPPNKLGLYDMGGNVWQWCMDWWNGEQKAKTLRGGSWYNGALKLSLLSSCRINSPPEKSSDNYGFRVVLAPVDATAAKK